MLRMIYMLNVLLNQGIPFPNFFLANVRLATTLKHVFYFRHIKPLRLLYDLITHYILKHPRERCP